MNPAGIRTIAVFAGVVTTAACGLQESGGKGDAWVGTMSTEGNVTTVVNESGSVWPGNARLVEEAVLDVFDAGGRYLAEIDMPDDIVPYTLPQTMHVDGDSVVAWTQDDLGTYRVKRYRLEHER